MASEGRVSSLERDQQVRALRGRRAEVRAELDAAKVVVERCRADLRHIDASICAVWDGKPAPARVLFD